MIRLGFPIFRILELFKFGSRNLIRSEKMEAREGTSWREVELKIGAPKVDYELRKLQVIITV